MASFTLEPYTHSLESVWNELVGKARQRSFLFDRGYMDYHRERFEDCSLVVFDAHRHAIALFPACISPDDKECVQSHGGLTYGGLLTLPGVTTVLTAQILDACVQHYASLGFCRLIYKPLPYIYMQYPCEEDLYWLFRCQAQLMVRNVSAVVDLQQPLPFSTLRKRKVRHSEQRAQLHFREGTEALPAYWQVLQEVLEKRHHACPVHSLDEMQRLTARFPEQIRLFTASFVDSGEVCAGCLLYLTPSVAHVQYIAANDKGCDVFALDALFAYVLKYVQQNHSAIRYFDFGTSNEQGGRVLNEGLIFQKEGFGARAVCYDQYILHLNSKNI